MTVASVDSVALARARRSPRMRAAGLTIALCVALSSSGCAKNRPSCDFVPESANLILEAGERLNPDESGRSLPTVVRLYQLSSIAAVEGASFEEIWRTPAETLGEALLGQEEVVLYPSQRQRRTYEREPEAGYLVAVAVFRRPTGTSWRSVLALPLPAAAQECLAQQEGEEAAPEVPSFVRFRLEDYAIRGELALEAPDESPCEARGGACVAATEQAAPSADAPLTTPPAPEASVSSPPLPGGGP